MNKEKYNQIIDEAYESYTSYPLATIHDHHTNILYQNRYKGWCMLNGRSMASPHPTRHLSQEEFINKCKTDSEFSEKWGLKIEERELSLEERKKLYVERCLASGDGLSGSAGPNGSIDYEFYEKLFVKYNVPTRLITITYNNEIIESYE